MGDIEKVDLNAVWKKLQAAVGVLNETKAVHDAAQAAAATAAKAYGEASGTVSDIRRELQDAMDVLLPSSSRVRVS